MRAIHNANIIWKQKHKAHNKNNLNKSKIAYVDKWVSNKQINQKLSNNIWKAPYIIGAQIKQTLIRQYMGGQWRGGSSHLHTPTPSAHYIHTTITTCDNIYSPLALTHTSKTST